jgi:ABC-type uncharacterized transport system auxiliary subunit
MIKRFGMIMLMIGITGCFGGAPPVPVRQYVLEYPPPRVQEAPPVNGVLKMVRFTVDRLYTSQAMLFRQGPFQRDAYQERRWRVSPAEMVTDFLKRDLRQAGLFRAVLTARDAEEKSRFVLEGGLEEFLEVDEGKGRMALLVATVALLDTSSREVDGRVVFQKTYRCESAFMNQGGADFAEAMSRAMSQFSAQVISDVGGALKRTSR